MVSRAEIDMLDIRASFKRLYGKSLYAFIKVGTSSGSGLRVQDQWLSRPWHLPFPVKMAPASGIPRLAPFLMVYKKYLPAKYSNNFMWAPNKNGHFGAVI